MGSINRFALVVMMVKVAASGRFQEPLIRKDPIEGLELY